MTVLFWDIDGTLLTTAKAGVFAWEDAVREFTGREFELVRMRIAGLTSVITVGRTYAPRAGNASPPVTTFAPTSRPEWM